MSQKWSYFYLGMMIGVWVMGLTTAGLSDCKWKSEIQKANEND